MKESHLDASVESIAPHSVSYADKKANRTSFQQAKIYDIEVYPNYFLVAFQNVATGERETYEAYQDEQGNVYGNLQHIWKAVEGSVLIGYNNKKFDNPLLCVVIDSISRGELQLTKLYNVAQELIGRKMWYRGKYVKLGYPYKYKEAMKKPYFQYIDLMELVRQGYNIKPLKLLAVNLKHPLIQDLPLHHEKWLTKEEANTVREYCWNDVEITHKVFLNERSRIDLRINLMQEFDLPVSVITEADSGIVNLINDKFYTQFSGQKLEDIQHLRTKREYDIPISSLLDSSISFKNPYLRQFSSELSLMKICRVPVISGQDKGKIVRRFQGNLFGLTDETKSIDTKTGYPNAFNLEVFGCTFTFGLGGIHTVDKAGLIEPSEDCVLIDIDVSSYYPYRVLLNEIVPEHLDKEAYLLKYKYTIESRLGAKKRAKELSKLKDSMTEDQKLELVSADTKNAGLKICINGEYGKYNYEYYYLYDVACTYRVTLNNQLDILRLAEWLEPYGRLLSANTDGLTYEIHKSKLEAFRAKYKQWEETTGFELEEVEYERIIRKDINNYMAVVKGGKVKAKGVFQHDESRLMLGWRFPIMTLAWQAYYANAEDPMTFMKHFIEDTPDYYHYFCTATKIDSKFTNVMQTVAVRQQLLGKTGKPLKRPRLISKVLNEEEIQNSVRYYVCKPSKKKARTENGIEYVDVGNYLMKKSKDKYISHLKDTFVFVANDMRDTRGYPAIDLEYYEKEIKKVIDKIEKTQ